MEKFSDGDNKPDDALTDLQNIGFMGSNVVSGSATAVVLATGNNTYFGSMAQSLSGDKAKTSFERGVESVSGLLVRRMLVMIPVVFLINGIAKGDWAGALLFFHQYCSWPYAGNAAHDYDLHPGKGSGFHVQAQGDRPHSWSDTDLWRNGCALHR
uniref:P-type ATPase n=1 Tax=Clostridium sp. NkU-1 TaxID=1095009 RepID=UPI003260245C